MIRLVVARYTFACRSVYKPIPKIIVAAVARITQRLRTTMRNPNIKSMALRSVSTEFGSKASTQCLPVADVRRVRCAVAANRTSTHQQCRGSKLTAFARIRPVLGRDFNAQSTYLRPPHHRAGSKGNVPLVDQSGVRAKGTEQNLARAIQARSYVAIHGVCL